MTIQKNLFLNNDKKSMKKIAVLFAFIFTFFGYSQELIWTGNASNNDFFDEANWENVNKQ